MNDEHLLRLRLPFRPRAVQPNDDGGEEGHQDHDQERKQGVRWVIIYYIQARAIMVALTRT